MGVQKIGLEAIMDMANFNKGMGQYNSGIDAMSGKTTTMGDRLAGFGKTIVGVGVAAAGAAVAIGGVLAKGLWECAQEAMGAEEATAALDSVLKSTKQRAGVTKKEALALAGSLQKLTRFSDEEILSAETLLLQFETMNARTFPEATALALDLATRLGTDATSAAQLLGKALAEPGEGLLRLKQAGVTFTDTEEKMIKSMFEAGDVAGAQKAILDKLWGSVGGASTASANTFQGQMDRIKNQVSDMKEKVGGPILAALETLGQTFLRALDSPEIQAAMDAITAWIAEKLPGVVSGALGAITMIYNKTRTILEELGIIKPKPTAASTAPDLGTVGASAFAKSFDFPPIAPVIAATIPDAAKTTKELGKEAGKAFWEGLSSNLDPNSPEAAELERQQDAALGAWLKRAIWQPIMDFFDNLWEEISEVWTSGWDSIFGGGGTSSVVPNLAPGGGTATQPAVTGSAAGFGAAPTVVSVGGDTVIQNITDPVSYHLAVAMAESRKRDKWNMAMGVS